MKAFVFPGQGAQFVGMGKDLYENSALAKELFEKANDILGYRITDIMFNGTDEDLRQTKVTQPAVFLHSVISALCMGDDFKPEMTAGHSLGEFSALVAAGALSFEDGLKLVYARAMAMQKACEAQPSTMAAIIALPDEKVEEICAQVSAEGEVCVAANYNCPGQIQTTSVAGVKKLGGGSGSLTFQQSFGIPGSCFKWQADINEMFRYKGFRQRMFPVDQTGVKISVHKKPPFLIHKLMKRKGGL